MRKLFILFCVVVTIGVIAGNKFCDLSCWDNETSTMVANVGCETNPESNFSRYWKSVKMGPMTDSLKEIIVGFYNEKRNFTAGGTDVKYKPACRMATMQWDDDLAHLAEIHIQKYDMVRDRCLKTNAFDFPGQSLFKTWVKTDRDTDFVKIIKRGIKFWYRDIKNLKPSDIGSYPGPCTYPPIAHYTVMMIDKNIRVGCSYGTNTFDQTSYVIMACNYATTNMKNKPIYEICNSPGELCKTGRNGNYTNLCSVDEEYDVNN